MALLLKREIIQNVHNLCTSLAIVEVGQHQDQSSVSEGRYSGFAVYLHQNHIQYNSQYNLCSIYKKGLNRIYKYMYVCMYTLCIYTYVYMCTQLGRCGSYPN